MKLDPLKFLPRCSATSDMFVHLSAHLPDAWIVRNERTYAKILISFNRSFHLVFWEEEWLVGTTPSTWNFGANWCCWSKNADFQSIFTCSASVVTPSERSSISTNRKSTMCFPMSLRWTSYVAHKPPQRGLISAKRLLKKVCYKVSLCENCQRQSFKAFTPLSIRAKTVHTGRPLLCKNSPKLTHPLQLCLFPISICL